MQHDEETRELALTTLALAGDNATKAAAMLEDHGVHVSRRTLSGWRDKYADRYREIRETRAAEIERSVVHKARALAERYSDLEMELLEIISQQAKDGTLKDPSTAARNAAVSKGINVDKMLVMSGRPDNIVAQRSADDILKSMEARGWVTYVDSDGNEIPPAKELPAAVDSP